MRREGSPGFRGAGLERLNARQKLLAGVRRYGEITGGCHSGSLHTAPSAASTGLFGILAVFYHSLTPGLVCCQRNSYRFEPGWKRPPEEIC